jgi:hypothetical protein
MSDVIYPIDYLTIIDEELKSIRCRKDYLNIYLSGFYYSYRLYRHDETGINIYVVYHHEILEPNFFTKQSLVKHFYTTDIFREEKLNSIGI